MTDDVLGGSNEPVVEEKSLEQKVAEKLANIKREDGSQMFDTVEKALDSLAHAQARIPELKKELEDKSAEVDILNTKLEKAATVDDVLNRITENKAEEAGANAGVEPVSEDKIGELVKQQMDSLRQDEVKASNRKQVNEALVAQFGDPEKARLALQSKAAELGVSTEEIAAMAEKSPKAVMAYFSAAPKAATPPVTNSVDIRASSTPQTQEVESFSLSKTNVNEWTDKMKQIKADVYAKHGVTG